MKTYIQKRIDAIKSVKMSKARERRYIAQLKRQGWSNMDLWGLNTHLANYMLPMFRQFFADPVGHPCDLKSGKEWQAIGAEIIWALERHAADDFFDLAEAKTGYKPADMRENMTLRKAWLAENKRLYARADAGMALFGKYFGNFWD
jgi:hypothetical protein